MIEIGKRNIRVGPQEFKGRWLIHIRQWFEKDGKMLPGKGIALNLEEWQEFLEKLPELKKLVKEETEQPF